MSKICNNCGQDLPDSAAVCSLCGEAQQQKPSPTSKKKLIIFVSVIVAVVVVCILIGVLVNIGGKNALVGKWNYDMNTSEGPPLLLSDSIEFAPNGTLRYNQGYGFYDAGKWSVSGSKLYFDAGDGYEGSLEYKVRGNTLTLTGSYELVYIKDK